MKTKITVLILLVYSFVQAQTVTTITDGSFYDGLGITSNGDIYCSNFVGNEVFIYNPSSNNVSTFVTGLASPNGIGVTPDDRIFVCESAAGSIRVYDTNGDQLNSITALNNPTGIKYNTADGSMYWVSYNQSSLNIMNANSPFDTEIVIEGAPLNGPSGIAFVNNETYISNYNDRKIFRLETDNTLTEIAQLPATAAQNNVLGFLTAQGGFLYGTQLGEHRIYKINPTSGEVLLYAGSSAGNEDGDISDATFNFPNGILGDDINNRIYISDAGTSNLRIIDNVTLGIDAFAKAENQLLIFPNPTGDSLQVQATLSNASAYSLSVHNTAGKLIQKMTENRKQLLIKTSINSSTWSRGVYIIKLTTENDVLTKKIIK